MTKLERKLIELGYKKFNYWYEKKVSNFLIVVEPRDEMFSKIHTMYVYENNWFIKKQEQIDNLQQAFDVMQKDLEELKKYEDKNI